MLLFRAIAYVDFPTPPRGGERFSARFGRRTPAKPRYWVSLFPLRLQGGWVFSLGLPNLLPPTKCHFMTVAGINYRGKLWPPAAAVA